jgi:hypothetical protein
MSGDAWQVQTATVSTDQARGLAAKQRRAERREVNEIDKKGSDL